MKRLDKVLKYLKKNKARDPHGFCNELFRPEVAGDDLKLALLKLVNRIKLDQLFPVNFYIYNFVLKKVPMGVKDEHLLLCNLKKIIFITCLRICQRMHLIFNELN